MRATYERSSTGRTGVRSRAEVVHSLRALLEGAIDYAGLFPPASLTMSEAVANYAAYRDGRHAWALGRFIVPLARLDEFAATLFAHSPTTCWRLSALAAGNDLAGEIATADRFNQSHCGTAVVDTLEFKVASTRSIAETARLADKRFVTFHEVSIAENADSSSPGDMSPLCDILEAMARAGSGAKVRTGGITTEAFPAPVALAQFLAQCHAAGVSFKATAGLHHPLRGHYPLTYETSSAKWTMHGFVNLLFAAAFAHAGWNPDHLADVLTDPLPSEFLFDPEGASWRGHRLTTEALQASRTEFLISFGSCSFEEPLLELKLRGWLPE